MIIILNEADFSANNLGQVEVETDIMDFTKNAILASGNASMTGEQKSALDNLFKAMGVDGSNDVMSKMVKVYIPMLANDVSKALVNYADEDFTVDLALNSANWKFQNRGLIGLASGQNITLTNNSVLNTTNYSCFVLRTAKMVTGVADGSKTLVLRGKITTTKFLGPSYNSASSNNYIQMNNYGAKWMPDTIKTADDISTNVFMYKDSTCRYRFGKTWGIQSSPGTLTDMTGETQQNLYCFGVSDMNMAMPYGVAMIGEGMELEVAQNIAEKIDNLANAFGVTNV